MRPPAGGRHGIEPLNAVRTAIGARAQSVTPSDLRRGLTVVGAIIVTQVLLVLLGAPDLPGGRVVTQALFVLAMAGCAVLAAGRVILASGRERIAWATLTVGAFSWVAAEIGAVFVSPVPAGQLGPPGVEVFFLIAYVAGIVGIGILAWAAVGGLRSILWLDVMAAAGAAAALTAALVAPLQAGEAVNSALLVTYPLSQGAWVGIAIGLIALGGARLDVRWLSIGAGVGCMLAANGLEFSRADGTTSHADPTLIHTLWALSIFAIAIAATVSPPPPGKPLSAGAIAAPAIAAVVSIALLITSSFTMQNVVAIVLASVALAAVVARLAVTLASNQRLLAAIRRQEKGQAALRHVATLVAADSEPPDVFAAVAEELGAMLDADAGLVCRFVDGNAVVTGTWGDHGARLGVALPLEGAGALAGVARTSAPSRVDDYRLLGDELDVPTRVARREGFQASVAAPVRVSGVVWGAVMASTRSTAGLHADAEDRIERFAELVGMAIDNSEAHARLVERAGTDSLTGLANHRTFQEALRTRFTAARRARRHLSLVLFDLDHFKQVNDAHGHQVGDRVLVEVARRLAGCARPGDVVARIGGEEFAWIMPEADGIAAYAAAERARVAAVEFPLPVAARSPITISAGVCDLLHASSPDELVRLADGSLYWAKAHGRDATYLYSPSVVKELSAQERAARLERQQALAGLRALARAVDAKDQSTRAHSERVADLATRIAARLGWSDDSLAKLHEAGLLHDVGKIGVPDAVLFKPGALSDEEYRLVKQHASLGAEIADEVLSSDQVSWIRGHHERWDGGGYPDGLSETAIPQGARILSIADAWDVMISVRSYKSPLSMGGAIDEVRRHSGAQFAPEAVAVLEQLWAEGSLLPTIPNAEEETAPAGELPPDQV